MKIYNSIFTNLKIHYKNSWIRFTRSERDGIGIYLTNDDDICKFIESFPTYGKEIWLAEEIKEEKAIEKVEEVVETPIDAKTYPEITSYQKAVGILVKDYGVARKEITNKEVLIEKAKEYGVEFPNL